jgi:hypothetical protein
MLSPQLFGMLIETICALLAARCPGAGRLVGLAHVPDLLYRCHSHADDLTQLAESKADMNALLVTLDLQQ